MSQNLPPLRWRRAGTLAALAGTALVALGACTADVIAYDLPPEPARYTFEVDVDDVHTEWEYTSARPTADVATEQQPCLGDLLGLDESPQPCRPEPLIFLRYDLGLALDLTAPAGRAHRIQITSTYQQQLDDPPEVTELDLEVTFDGGESWQGVRTRPAGAGTFAATVVHPNLSETDGAVGLRATAIDNAGNTVVQTIPHAYSLR